MTCGRKPQKLPVETNEEERKTAELFLQSFYSGSGSRWGQGFPFLVGVCKLRPDFSLLIDVRDFDLDEKEGHENDGDQEQARGGEIRSLRD